MFRRHFAAAVQGLPLWQQCKQLEPTFNKRHASLLMSVMCLDGAGSLLHEIFRKRLFVFPPPTKTGPLSYVPVSNSILYQALTTTGKARGV
jgi:hypothetical protein